MKLKSLRVVALVSIVVGLAGCAANTPKPPPPPNYGQLMQQADARYAVQDFDGATVLYKKAAAADPAREVPWYRMAKISFDQQNYGRAIVDAQEALRRDPTDKKAESILTVSGLRVAVEALGRLHDEANDEGPAHMEAENLAKAMRATLGQDVLVPPKSRSRRRRVYHHKDVAHEAAPAAAAPAAPASSNPFQSLPGSSGN